MTPGMRNHPEKGANRTIESEYVNFIRDCIRKLTPADESKVISIPGLNRFLPDDDETPEESFDGVLKEGYRQETSERSPLPEKIPGRKVDSKAKPMQPDHLKPNDADSETEDEQGEGVGNGPRKEEATATGTGATDGRKGTGNTGDTGGSHGGASSKPSIPIRYRTYARDSATGVYHRFQHSRRESLQEGQAPGGRPCPGLNFPVPPPRRRESKS